MNSDLTQFAARAERFAQLCHHVGDRWAVPTPCEGWTAADLVAHVVDTQRDFLAQHGLAAPDPDRSDPAAAFEAHARDTIAALSHEGVADRGIDGYFGPSTVGATLNGFYGWDLVVHGWDLARATGQPDPLDEAEAASMLAGLDAWGPALYSEGICRQPVPVADDAPVTDRLVAALGRDPHWGA